MNAIFKNFVIRKTSLFGLLAAFSASSYADVMDQLELGSEFGTEVRSIKEYDPSVSKYDRSQDQHNPFLGKLHRTADSGFSPQSDLSLFIKRMREGVSLYKKRGVTKFSNQYNLFKTIYSYLPGKSLGEDGGQPVVAKFRRSPQLFLIYRIYEAKDGRAKLLCYDNSEGRIGSSGLVGQRKTYAIWGYKLKKGYRFTEGGVTGKPVYFDLVDPHGKLMDESEYDNGIVSRIRDAQDKSEKVDSILGADDEWESNPPHPDNIGYTDGQIDKKVEGKKDIFKTILDPLMFGAKLGVGAYMLKEAFKKKDDDDDDDDEFGGDYGYGMDYGMGYGSEYGMGSIMGPGNMMGMYPGMYPRYAAWNVSWYVPRYATWDDAPNDASCSSNLSATWISRSVPRADTWRFFSWRSTVSGSRLHNAVTRRLSRSTTWALPTTHSRWTLSTTYARRPNWSSAFTTSFGRL